MESMVLSFSEAFSEISSRGNQFGLPRITLRHLVYFTAAARNESVLRAAAELNVSPPAISGAISGLESILGERLFIRRHARGLVLTDAGHHLLLEARDIIGQVWEIESIRSKAWRKLRGRIAFGCLGDIAPSVVPPLLHKFQSLHPQVEVAWQTDSHGPLMQRLEDGALDVIFVMDFEISPTLHSTVLQPTPVQVVLPNGHPLAKGSISLRDFAEEPFILLDVAKTRDYFLSIFGDFGLQPNIATRAPSAEMVRSLVANGFGYSLLNFSTAERHDIVYRPLNDPIRPSNLVAVRPYRRRPSKIGDDFVQLAATIARRSTLSAQRLGVSD
jgi:DNA-binding transcriptional LysR family regulator